MSRILILIFFTLIFSFGNSQDPDFRKLRNESFGPGEVIEYRIHIGFINAGKGRMIVRDELEKVNDRMCYKIDVYGNTVGIWDYIVKVRDEWTTYLDKDALIPQHFKKKIREGKFRRYETVYYDHLTDSAVVQRFHKETLKLKNETHHALPDNTQDAISGYYFMRTLDYSRYKPGDIISMDVFFDREQYKFRTRYVGKDRIRTRIGRYNTIVLAPILPKNRMFRGKNAVKIWLSDDKAKIPLKIKASMKVGAAEIDITKYEQGRVPE